MEKKWADLSPDEKRQQRLQWFASTEDINFVSLEAEKAYKVRMQRMVDVYNVQEPDRVPVNMFLGNIPLRVAGINLHTAMYDYDKLVEAYERFNNEYDLDTYVSPMVMSGKAYDLLDYKLYVWPGHGLPTSATGFQFVEGEYMKADEYDALIRDPSDFFMRVYMPRVFGAFESYRLLPSLINTIEMPTMYFMPYTNPDLQAALQALVDIGQELSKMGRAVGELTRRGKKRGFPSIEMGSFGKAPFDTLGDTLRGTQGIMMDMYRQPDRLLEALDVIADMTINSVVTSANDTKGLLATFPLHKGADGWMSQKQFETFYWPSLRKVINALIDEGIIVSPFAEGSYNTRLESINEFPKGTVQWWFDQTDMARAKEILGDRCCISGNVPASMLVAGTPQEVKEYCRHLIEVCGQGGGFMLAPGTAGVDNAKLENMLAMLEAAKEYGVYK